MAISPTLFGSNLFGVRTFQVTLLGQSIQADLSGSIVVPLFDLSGSKLTPVFDLSGSILTPQFDLSGSTLHLI